MQKYSFFPVEFAEDCLDINTLTADQKAVLDRLTQEQIVEVTGHHATGKTFMAAIAAIWWARARKGTTIVVTPVLDMMRCVFAPQVSKLTGHNVWDANGYKYGFHGFSFYGCTMIRTYEDCLNTVLPSDRPVLVIWDEQGSDKLGGKCFRLDERLKDAKLLAISTSRETEADLSLFRHPNTDWAYQSDYTLKPEFKDKIVTISGCRDRGNWDKSMPKHDPIPGAIAVEWWERFKLKQNEIAQLF